MTRRTFDELVEDARSLTPEEQRRLRGMLDEWIWSTASLEERQGELDRRLMAKGLLSRIPPPIPDLGAYRDRRPVVIEGEPLSETIIRERR